MLSFIINSIGNVLAKFFEFEKSKVENQVQTEIIENKKDYKKAVDIAEQIIDIAQNYKSKMTFAHRLKFVHLVNDFKKYN